jgi:hypothetical protein
MQQCGDALLPKFDPQLLRVKEFVGSSHKHPDRSGGTANISEVVIMRSEVLLHAPLVRSSRGVHIHGHGEGQSVCYVSGINRYRCVRNGPKNNGGQGGN